MVSLSRRWWSVVGSIFLLAAGCGGNSATVGSSSDGGRDGTIPPIPNDAGADTSVPNEAAPPDGSGPTDSSIPDAGPPDGSTGPCPTSAPTPQSTCPTIGVTCVYGSNPNPACDQEFECVATGWKLIGNTGQTCPAPDSGEACPPTEPTGDCSGGELCAYPGATCICSHGAPPMVNASWHCSTVPMGCPQFPPPPGSSCSDPGLDCNYGSCIGSEEVMCTNGTWKQIIGPCPG
jgi:hypothetical protein